ncbi:Lachesin, partial [Eufriesea mexicana]
VATLNAYRRQSAITESMMNRIIKARAAIAPEIIVGASRSTIACFRQLAGFEPDFVRRLENITISQGRDATFTCVVSNLGGYRVAWIKADTKAVLAIDEHVITNNARLSVTHSDYNTWTLNIRGVRREDRGIYMCQVNTNPMKSQSAFLEVVIPPDIISEETSNDLMVPEGGSAKLVCKARGFPKPEISWKREDGVEIISRAYEKLGVKISSAGKFGSRTTSGPTDFENLKFLGSDCVAVASVVGETLTLSKVSRSEMGTYLCIASNGVPPSVSKRMTLHVHFRQISIEHSETLDLPILETPEESKPLRKFLKLPKTADTVLNTDNREIDATQLRVGVFTRGSSVPKKEPARSRPLRRRDKGIS